MLLSRHFLCFADADCLAKIWHRLVARLIADSLPPVCYIPLLKQLLEEERPSPDFQASFWHLSSPPLLLRLQLNIQALCSIFSLLLHCMK